MKITNVNGKAVSRGLELQWRTLLSGVETSLGPTKNLIVNGRVLSQSEIVKVVQQEIAPHEAVRQAKIVVEGR